MYVQSAIDTACICICAGINNYLLLLLMLLKDAFHLINGSTTRLSLGLYLKFNKINLSLHKRLI